MKLSTLLKPEFVLLKQQYKTHNELLGALIAELYRGGQKIALSEDVVRNGVMNRVALQGVLLSTGLSIPHAKFEGLDDFVIVIGVPETPMPTRVDSPVRMMTLILSPTINTTQHLNILAAFARLSKGELFPKLCEETDAVSFIRIIENAGIDIGKDFNVSSIMSTTLKILHPENTLREALDMFRSELLGYVPIMDNDNNFVGELSINDIFAICIPSYALSMKNLKFLSSFEPLEDLLRNENNILVGDVMKKPSITLDEDSPVIEAVLKFVQTRRRYLPVLRGKHQLVGVVGYMDILKKVLRA
jgi:CBS domain-containing protein